MTIGDEGFSGELTYIWAIENCITARSPVAIRSPSFGLENTRWHVTLAHDKENVFLRVYREMDNGPYEVEISVDFSLIVSEGYRINLGKQQTILRKCEFIEMDKKLKLCDVFEFNSNVYLPNDTLTSRCRMFLLGSDRRKTKLCFARTLMGNEVKVFYWRIRNYSTLPPGEEVWCELNPIARWCPYVTLILRIRSAGSISVKLIVDSEERVCYSLLFNLFDERRYTANCFHRAWGLMLSSYTISFDHDERWRNHISQLPNDVLTLRCVLLLSTGPIWSRIECDR